MVTVDPVALRTLSHTRAALKLSIALSLATLAILIGAALGQPAVRSVMAHGERVRQRKQRVVAHTHVFMLGRKQLTLGVWPAAARHVADLETGDRIPHHRRCRRGHGRRLRHQSSLAHARRYSRHEWLAHRGLADWLGTCAIRTSEVVVGLAGALPLLGVVLMAGAMAHFFAGLSRAGIAMSSNSKPLERLPDGVTAFNGWANRLLVVAFCAWAIVTAWYLIGQRRDMEN